MEQKMSVMSKDQILATPVTMKTIEIPEWGNCVNIKVMSGTEREAWSKEVQSRRKPDGVFDSDGLTAVFLSYVLVDYNGDRLFMDEQDIKSLQKKNGVILERIYAEAELLNGYGRKGEQEAAKN